MGTRTFLIWSAVIMALLLAFTGWAWTQIPDGARIATHWNGQGVIDGYMPKPRALLFAPVTMLGLTLLFWIITKVEPRRNNLKASRELIGVVWIGTLLLVGIAQVHVVFTALGVHMATLNYTVAGLALLIVAMGNVLSKSRAMYLVGIRTPWTLDSDYSWEKTHRWGGRLFMLTGLATLIALGLYGAPVAMHTLLWSVGITAGLCILMSYVFWRQDPEHHSKDSIPE